MPISRFREKRSSGSALVCALFALGALSCMARPAEKPRCKVFELPRASKEHPYSYESSHSNWIVVVNELNGDVVVRNRESGVECSASVDGVRQVYAGATLIALRSIEIASDDVFFIDAATCKDAGAPIHLGASDSEQAKDATLARHGVCAAER